MSDPRVVAPEARSEDAAEASLRPLSLDEFVGQRQTRENLRVFIQAARSRGEPLDHVLLFGPPGLRKTTLAQIIAREMARDDLHDKKSFAHDFGPDAVTPEN